MSDPVFEQPSLTPNIYQALPFYRVVEDKFYYSLTSDDETYIYWATAVNEPTVYESSGNAIVKSGKFSPFMIIWRCTTEEQYDGCCMISESDGAVCLLRDTRASEMLTYRYSHTEWLTLLSKYKESQEDFEENFGTPYKAGDNNVIEYLDSFVCAQNDEDENESTCYIY